MRQFSQNSTSNKFVYTLLVVLCLVVSFRYRYKNYYLTPPVHDTFDEFAAGWSGLSLIKSGIPTSWSFIPDYASGIPNGAKLDLKNLNIWVDEQAPSLTNLRSFPKPILLTRELELDGYRSHFNIVSPYLEQPPLGAVVISMPLFFSGIDNFSDTTLSLLRKPFVFYGVISTFLVMLLSRLLYGRSVSLVSGFIYATIPTVVVGSRLALPENILVPLFLLLIYLLVLYKKNKSKSYVRAALIICFMAPLVKPFGLALPLAAGMHFVFVQKDKKLALMFALVGLVSFSSYVFYGLLIDKDTFIMVLSYQSKRFFSGPLVFVDKILIPRITKIFLDGWIFFGWISFFHLCLLKKSVKKYFPILVPVASYVVVTSFFGGEDFGWYRFPFYPFLAISSGIVVAKILKKPTFFPSVVFSLTAFFFSLQWGLGIINWNTSLVYFRIILLVVIFVLFLNEVWKKEKLLIATRRFMIFVFIISLYLNTRIVNNMGKIWTILGDDSSLIQNRR